MASDFMTHDDAARLTAEERSLIRLHVERRCADSPAHVDRLLTEIDALRAELEASRAREAALEAALGHAVEAVQFLLDEDWPQTCDPGPGIRTDLTRWQALLAGRAVPEDA